MLAHSLLAVLSQCAHGIVSDGNGQLAWGEMGEGLMGAPSRPLGPRMFARSVSSDQDPPPVWPPQGASPLVVPPTVQLERPAVEVPMSPFLQVPPGGPQRPEAQTFGGAARAVVVGYDQGQQVCDSLVAPRRPGPKPVCIGDVSPRNDIRGAGALYPLRCLNDKLRGPGGVFSRACMMCNVPQLDGVAWAAIDRGGKPCTARYQALRLLGDAATGYDSRVIDLLRRATGFIETNMMYHGSVDDALNSRYGTQLLRGYEAFADTNVDGEVTLSEAKALLQAIFIVADAAPEVAVVGGKSPEQLEAWTSFAMSNWLAFAPGFVPPTGPSAFSQPPQDLPGQPQEVWKQSAYPPSYRMSTPWGSSAYPPPQQGYYEQARGAPWPPEYLRQGPWAPYAQPQPGYFQMKAFSMDPPDPVVRLPRPVTPAPGGQDTAVYSLL